MHLDPALPPAVAALFVVLIVVMLLTRLRQPHVVGYLVTGIILGPHVFGLITDQELVARLGNIGVVLLLFFIGMEISPKRLLKSWRIAVIGTIAQILISVFVVWLVGEYLGWTLSRSVLLGFVISLSSTAVVLKILQDKKELDSDTGQNVLGVLLFQDMAIIPMLIIIGLMSGNELAPLELSMQISGGIVMLLLAGWIIVKESIRLPLGNWIKQDHELQIFMALTLCFGLALLTGVFNLSTALGAFIGGMLIGAAKETQWVHNSLNPFRVLFVALFFMSVGLLVDMDFIILHWQQVSLLTLLVLTLNFFINTGIIRLLGDSWHDSIYSGALLAQVGEFGFVLASVGFHSHMISDYGYQLTITVVAVTLILSPALIAGVKMMLCRKHMDSSNQR
jgi:CPA2 family monovalent cation:H+ antiporter-2